MQVPSGLLPVLEIDGRVVTESAVIMNLLEDAFPDHKPLMPPAGSPQRSRADQLMRLERRWAVHIMCLWLISCSVTQLSQQVLHHYTMVLFHFE